MLILVVDDHEPNRRLLTMLLEMDGHAVMDARDVAETYEQLARLTPDAILMDVQLPDGDGLEVVRDLRTQSHLRDVLMYAVTADLLPEVRRRADLVGCDGFFEKPLDAQLLLGTLRRP